MTSDTSMRATSSSRVKLYAGLGFLALVWGTQFLVIKIGQRALPPLLTVALRFAILALACEIAVLATRPRSSERAGASAREPMHLLRLAYGGAQAVCMCLLYWAEARMSSSVAGVLLATTPFFVALLAHLLIEGDRLSGAKLVATTLGFVGIGTVMLGGAEHAADAPAIGVVAVIAAALFGAVNKVLSKRLTHVLPAPVMLRDLGVVVAISAGLASLVFERDHVVHLSAEAIAAFLYLGLVGSAAASTVYLMLLRSFAVTSLAYLQFVTALIAVFVGVTLGSEALRASTAIGASLVLAGLWVLARSQRASAPVPVPARPSSRLEGAASDV